MKMYRIEKCEFELNKRTNVSTATNIYSALCNKDCGLDGTLIAEFDTREEALEALKGYKSTCRKVGTFKGWAYCGTLYELTKYDEDNECYDVTNYAELEEAEDENNII